MSETKVYPSEQPATKSSEETDAAGFAKLETRESSQELVEASENEPKKYYFGISCWHPGWLQILANAKFFTFLLCINGLVEGALVSGFSSVVLSSIERRFRLSSTAVSVLLVSFDLSVLLCVIFISYFGDKRHKPRWIGIGLIVQGIGALIFALPQFVFGKYEVGSEGSLTLESCSVEGDYGSSCNSSNILAYLIMLFGNVLIGVGAAPLFTLGLSYIDDITFPKYVPIHMGLFYVAVAVGPAIGYGLGGAFLSIYVDPSENTSLEELDPGWVGAWWLCFVFSGILSLIISVPFLMYPRVLSNYAEVVEAHRAEHVTSYTSKYGDEASLKDQLKAFPLHMWDLCKSPSFVFVTAALSFLFLTLYGLVAFGPKFVESVFNIPASTASILAGAIAIPAGGLGTIVGSLMAYFLKSNTKRVAIIPWIASLMIIPALLGFFITCPSLPVVGISMDYPNNAYISSEDITIASCNSDCMCNSTIFEPVCGADDLTYFSPCRAGCQKTFMNDSTEPVFSNCACISESLSSMNTSTHIFSTPSQLLGNSTATAGRCPQKCNTLGIWLLLIGIVVFLIFVLRIPTLLITIRSVAEEQRSLALGVQSVIWRALGSIPGPIIFGVIFDSSCVYWQFDCGRRGNCWVYNNDHISIRAFFITTTGVLVNFVFMLLCWIFYPPITCFKKQAEKGEKGKVAENPVFNPDAEIEQRMY